MGTSEEIFETGVKKHSSRCLPFEERKINKHPAKWLSPLGISEEKNNSIKAAHFAISRWLLFGGDIWKQLPRVSHRGVCKEIVNISENTSQNGLSQWE